MKKRYIFLAAYVTIMTVMGTIVLLKTHIGSYEVVSPAMDIMLLVSGGMGALLIFAILIWRIVKFILVKLGIQPDDYFIIRVDARKSIDHWLLTTNGKYDRKNDKAELERDKRDNQTVEW